MRAYSTIESPCLVCQVEDSLGEERGTQSHPINCGWRINNEKEGYLKGLEDVINLCLQKDTVVTKDLVEKIRRTALISLYSRYDIKGGD